ncbi:MAG: extracellular solute-binding protein [Deltaproteobacteria bacterium]|nr:extracellular solute-binding protein [Deltaproteobacteria bacterium]
MSFALTLRWTNLAAVWLLFICSISLAQAADPKMIEAAKKEGGLDWWSTIAQDQSQKIIDEFMKRYPFIKASYWRSGTVGLHNKILIEDRAGRTSWDVVSQTAPEFIVELKVRKLIAAYNSPERRNFSADFKDKEGFWTGTYALPTGLGFNTQQVKTNDVPKSYQELLDPKWKGRKISVDDESYELLIGLIQSWGKDKAVEYLKRVAAQEPMIGRGHSQRTQLLAAGEFPLAIAYTHTVEHSKSQGNSVDWANLEPVVIKFDGIMLGSKAAHPNAARLFIDFILSQPGQQLLQSFNRVTLREGVEPSPSRLIKGFKRVVLHPEKAQDAQESLKLYREIFSLP